MGYAPADDPQIAIYVVVDRPNVGDQDDAKFATKLVRSILTEALPYLGIFMTEEVTEEEQAELDALNLENTNYYRQQAVSGNDIPPLETEEGGEAGEGEGAAGSPGEGAEDTGTTGGDGDTAGDGNEGAGAAGGEEAGGTGTAGGEGGFVPEIWKTFDRDPDTGNYIDPNTGHQIDPETGHDLDAGSLIGSGIKVAGSDSPESTDPR